MTYYLIGKEANEYKTSVKPDINTIVDDDDDDESTKMTTTIENDEGPSSELSETRLLNSEIIHDDI